MKKLLIAEIIAIIASIAMVIAGSIMGWPDGAIAVMTYVVAVVFVTVVSAGAFSVAIAAVAAGVAAVVVAVFAPIATVVGSNAVFIAVTIATISIAAVTGIVSERLKMKYLWVFLSLLGEGVVVGAILYYGPTMIRAVV